MPSRGDEPPGLDRLHLATGDPDQAGEALRHGFPGIHLRAITGGPAFRFDYHRVSDGRLSVNRLRLTGRAEGRGSMTAVVAAGRVRDGRLGLDYGRDAIDTASPYLRPAGRSVAVIENATLELIELEPAEFGAAARRYLEGSGRILRTPTPGTARPRTPELVVAWRRLSDHVADVALDDEAFASPLIRAGLFDLLVAGLLATFPLAVDVGAAVATQMRSSAIRRALAYIEDHLAEPMDVATIAAAARLSVRGLQAGFQRQLGVTPLEHLRIRRLAAVHDELADAGPAPDVSVAAIARRWGFAHPSRFAGQYRAVYHEAPSETLRR